MNVSSYSVTNKLYESVNTVVYRGFDRHSQQPVIIKVLRFENPTQKGIARLRHEYEISKDLEIEGIVKPYALVEFDSQQALILEDFGGESLKRFLESRTINTKEFLVIALQLVETLGELHQRDVLHKDIKPQNIIINSKTGQVKITDFSIASRLSRENQTISNPNLLEGTLAYMSPEQTGRMNRAIDYRTDFYSLGITFYEMVTGQVPYPITDPMELVHCHIAKNPVPPHELNSAIPDVVSALIMKLLAKTAEDRYQSAYGIKADLENCLQQLETSGIIQNFTLGVRDVSSKFQIPQKLYGREQEVATLLAAFDRIAGIGHHELMTTAKKKLHVSSISLQSKSEMMLVAGYSGIGKSALVNEIHKPIVRQKGYFIAGKFDQFKRNIPYASLTQAFQELVRQILTESEAQIEVWKEKLINALGPNGQVIIDVIPEVELIIGSQVSVPQLGASESQSRFSLVFQQFLSVFAQKEHPLVVFLDDLQWADSASLKLLQLLMTASEQQCLLLLGAYRDNEVNATHPLILTLEKIQSMGTVVNTITLSPLTVENVNQLISDTLHCEPEKVKPLADLLFQKTGGNPFFLTQMLTSLHQEKLLSYNIEAGRWQWTLGQIQQVGITDNVVDLMVSKLQKLSESTQQVMKLAACIGSTFRLNLLAIVNEKSLSATATELWEALQAGLILPLNDDYKLALMDEVEIHASEIEVSYCFLHDRVQQAAYLLIPEERKKETHLKVGQLLLKYTNPAERDEKIFDIVNQLNIGIEFITSSSEKYDLAELNLSAGRRAKVATAYEPALKYLRTGLGLLAEDSWKSYYQLTSELYIETVEVEYLNTHFEEAEQLSQSVLEHTQDLLQKVKVYQIKIYFNIARNQMLEAIATSLQVLGMLGEHLTQEAPEVVVVEELIHLPEMTDPHKLAAMEILITLLTPCLNAKPDLIPSMSFTLVNLAMRYGNSSFAAMGYALYGLILCGGLNRIEEGYRFGQLSLKLQEQFHTKELEAKVINIFNVFIRHWKEPARTTLEPLLAGIQSGVETGDTEYACYNSTSYCNYLFFVGESLQEVKEKQAKYIDLLVSLKQEYQIYFARIIHQLVLNLLGEVDDHHYLVGESFNELEMVPIFIETNMGTLLFLTYLAKMVLLYVLKDYEQALTFAQKAEPYHGNMVGFMQFAEYNFYYSLSLLAVYEQASLEAKNQYLEKVISNQIKLKEWAIHAPENYQHKYDLVEAEKARVLGQFLEAIDGYDRAIKAAREQKYVQEEAIANELAADFHFSQEREELAHYYLTKAYRSYTRWGAIAKVNDLELQHPKLTARTTVDSPTASLSYSRSASTFITGSFSALDLMTIVKASQAIAGEIVINQLLDKLLKIVMENAGAQISGLILEREGHLRLEAIGNVEQQEITLLESMPIANSQQLPVSVINYVARTLETLVLNDATREEKFARDPYIASRQSKSILCLPIVNKGKLIGLLYLENNLTAGAFTPDRLELLQLLSSQVAISLENALLYSSLEAVTQDLKQANVQLEDYSRTLEQKVEVRTLELKEKNEQLEFTVGELQRTQTQLIQTEKMSSLGQLVAGVAHEINNPVNFIHGNLSHVSNYTRDMVEIIHRYQQQYPESTPEIQAFAEEIDLGFLIQDLPKTLNSMQVGADRIRQIVLSLRNFSRLDEADMKRVNIHEGIESTLLILQHRLMKRGSFSIELVKEYGELPLVECYAGQLNQVLMNLLSNAIDALEECDCQRADCTLWSSDRSQMTSGVIRIQTEMFDQSWVRIRIRDNGPGIPEAVRTKLFDPFFTTKPVGSGTGLGLSISYQIVVEKHGGHLRCESTLGQGAEFIIEIPIQQKGAKTTKLQSKVG